MEKVIFRSSMAGYNKRDVNKYISDVDARHAFETEEIAARAGKLEAELAALRTADEERCRELNEMKNKAEELEENLEKTRRELEDLRTQCREAEMEASDRAREITELRGMLAGVPNDIPSAAELEDLRRRAAAYDELNARKLAVPQSGAAAEADNVIRSAYNEAERIRQEAHIRSSADACEKIKGQVSGELGEIYELINRTAAESLDDILANMRSAEAGVGRLSEELYDKNRTAVVRVEKLRAEIERLIDQKIAETESVSDKVKISANENVNENSNSNTGAGAVSDAVSNVKSIAGSEQKSNNHQSTCRGVRRGQDREHAASKQRRDDGLFRFGRRK